MDMINDVKPSSISTDKCGIIFLSTPLGGSQSADLVTFLQRLSPDFFGVRQEVINVLKTSSSATNARIRQFLSLEPCPKYACFCETQVTVLKTGIYREFVSREDSS
jgi:hypothetical protein